MKERFKLIVAVHLFVLKEDKILLMRRFNTGYEDGNYSVPAGHLDGNESARTAMIREALEEVGITIKPDDLEFVHVMHRNPFTDTGSKEERIDFFFAVREYEGTLTIKEPHKCNELRWAPLNKLPDNVIPYVKMAVEQLREKSPFSEFGW